MYNFVVKSQYSIPNSVYRFHKDKFLKITGLLQHKQRSATRPCRHEHFQETLSYRQPLNVSVRTIHDTR